MEESEDNLSAEDIKYSDSPSQARNKSKKRSLVERELETNLTARVTSPITNGESTSRYGRARRFKAEETNDSEKNSAKSMISPKFEKSPTRIQSPVYKMHASNSPIRMEASVRSSDSKLEMQIENIYNENMSLSRFGSDDQVNSSAKKSKVYIRKDLIQSKDREKEEEITLIKNIFSPVKSNKPRSTHLGNILERSCEKYNLSAQNGHLDNSSVVKTLDFDGNKKKKRDSKDGKGSLSKSEIFEMEAKCSYQVGDLAWARMGTYPFWPCIITRDPLSGTFVKRKLFGRIERDVLHVTFFGDNGRRGWIVDNMLRKFMGRLEFETTRENYTSEEKKRDPRLYAAFFTSEKKQSQWEISVEEAESLLCEPKRLRIDILRDILEKSQVIKTTPKSETSRKLTRTNSDVSLSESLYDTLFSEDDSKNNESERSRSKARKNSLNVSEVVTACLDNMAAKTGITKIQRQSHMDRWLQKAKSKTPEKTLLKTSKTEKESRKNKRSSSKESGHKRSLSLRRCRKESQDTAELKLQSHQNEHDYSKIKTEKVNNDDLNDVCDDEVRNNINGQVSNNSVENTDSNNEIHDEESDAHFSTNEELYESEIDLQNRPSLTNGDVKVSILNGIDSADDSDDDEIDNVESNEDVIDKDISINRVNEINNSDADKIETDSNTNSQESNTINSEINSIDISKEELICVNPDKESEDDDTVDESDCDAFSSEDSQDIDSTTDIDSIDTKGSTKCSEVDQISASTVYTDDSNDSKPGFNDETIEKPIMIEYINQMDDGFINTDNVTKDDSEIGQRTSSDKIVDGNNTNQLSAFKLDLGSSVSVVLSNAVTIEDNLTNCEMICLPSVVEKIDDINLDSAKCDLIELSNCDSNIALDAVNVQEIGQSLVIPLDIDISKAEDVCKDERDFNELVNGDIVPKQDITKEDKDFLEDRSNRTSLTSVNSDNTELLSSIDPQSEIDLLYQKMTADQKSMDGDSVSIKSEYSEHSDGRRRQPRHLKSEKTIKVKTESAKSRLDDPEFLKYLEMRQDALIDENPGLTQDDITEYLYNTWMYEQSSKSDRKRTDDIEQASLVKGLNQEPVQAKKQRKQNKAIKELTEEELPKLKSKRKIIRPYYNEDYSDLDSDFDLYDDYQTYESPKQKDASRVPLANAAEENGVTELLSDEDFDQVEEYFEQLTKAKPNLFKGLIRERVCEICERPGNLLKCKGCHSTYHLECTKKETEVIETQLRTRGRKKKKRNRGRKRKSSEDPNGLDNGSQSDERSQDVNASEENVNLSLDDIDSESRLVVDADEVEARLSAILQEMIKGNEYCSDSSENELSWSDTEAGKCRIVDVPVPKSRSKTEVVDFKCNACAPNEPACFVCKSSRSPRGVDFKQKCQVAHCHRRYHLECLDHWPQTQFGSGVIPRGKPTGYFEPFTCPRHVCHTCVSDDPRGCKTRFSGDKLARCVRCPATYHTFTKCLPAGTQILTGSAIICPRHYEHRPGKVPCHVNTGWCFICALGGSLICCEYCPTSFHAECLNIKPPEGGYMCEDCETGRLPLYGEMVWVKLGHYRWWPGIILHPSEIPANIMAVKHSPGEFVVRFFGQYDHYWVNRGRVFPFQEGDSGKVSSQKSKIDAAFTMAMEHAQRACEILKTVEPNDEESMDIASSLLPPHYVKLKVNKPCGSLIGRKPDAEASLTQCDCGPEDEDPCGPYSQCLNRMLLTECGPGCRTGLRCNNRAFEKREYPRLVPYRTPQRGWGLKTLEHIRAGQFVIEYVGELIDEEEFKRRMIRKHEIRDENYYFLTLDKERMIDAGPKGNLARFMNHCCEPNCETQKWTVLGDVRVGLFALRDIPANSEVTFNYNLECAGIEKKRCLCGAKRCSGYMGAKPKQNEPQPKKPRKDPNVKRTYKKRKNVELSPVGRGRPPKRRVSKPKELTDIERDLLIIKSATDGISSDDDIKDCPKKRKRLYEDSNDSSPSAKRAKSVNTEGD